jgi:ribosomal protein L40E
MKRKVYFFHCRECLRRLPQSEEAWLKPGVCKKCYAKIEIGGDELKEWMVHA